MNYTGDMSLPSTYADRNCSLARTLEVVGERWTLLIVRDAFYGMRRFGDFAAQLGIPRAVLTNRLRSLVEAGVLDRDEDGYRLTAKGIALWPVVRAMMAWGDEYYAPAGAPRSLRHDEDGGLLDPDGHCPACGRTVPVADIRIEPGPGFDPSGAAANRLSAAVNGPRRLLEPLTG
jgi:DNA-binding HxlR family transcriptional regulator